MRCQIRGGKNTILLLQFLILSTVAGSASDFREQNHCSSSCGLQSIGFPFRLKSDPAFCGDQDFELACVDNKTVMELPHGKYHVTNISYEYTQIQIVDANLASGRCTLPFRFPSAGQTAPFIKKYALPFYTWASFVNCSKEIKEDIYHRVRCLSGNYTFVYVVYDYQVAALRPSCVLLSKVPTNPFVSNHTDMISDDDYLQYLRSMSSEADIFKFLRRGFILSWVQTSFTRSQLIKKCLVESSQKTKYNTPMKSIFKRFLYPILLENNFLGCLHNYEHYQHVPHVPYKLAIIFIVTLDIAVILLVIAMIVRFIVAPVTIYVFLAYECWKLMVPIDSIEKFLRNQQSLTPTRYAYTDIISMTRHLKEKIGQGGFGTVYKGQLLGGNLVAVKMLGNSKCNGDEFINEVSTIGRIHHLNVVRLVGFCSEGSKRALVYEFMPNGSLDKYIFSSNRTCQRFTMEKLNEIALGVARGIDYLHRGCDMRILHFDIKPYNILLDGNFNPKVSDFGLAKLYSKDYSLVSMSATRGTIGYIAPELVSRSFGVISHKSDVYSFGMLLMEMAGGRRNVDHRAENSSQTYYPSWIYDRLVQSEGVEICKPIEIEDMERKLCKVGLWCIQMRPSERPSMSRVIEMLEADMDTLQLPPKPFLSTGPVSLRGSRMDSYPSESSIISEDG